jgi:hypothetical protein
VTFLHWTGNALRELLELVPLSMARWVFIGLFLVLMFWILQLPTSEVTPQDRQSRWYEDLRIWAWVSLMCQVLIYSMF